METPSSILRLQTEQMLNKLRPKYEKRMTKLDSALRRIKTIIENLPETGPLTYAEIQEARISESDSQIPFPDPRPTIDTKYKFTYYKPSNINVVGSYARKTAIDVGEQNFADMAIMMPSTIFQEKDYLNYRYFHKRAFFLAHIAKGIAIPTRKDFAIEYALQNDNHLQPIIVITPIFNGGEFDFSDSKFSIRLILAADGDLFPVAKLSPEKNSIRMSSDRDNQETKKSGTPFYNATLRSELCTVRYLKLLHAASSQSEGFLNSCMMGAVWLRQRGCRSGLLGGGFGPFEWACLAALLLRGGGFEEKAVLSKNLESLQLFRGVLQYIATKRFLWQTESGLSDGDGELSFGVPMLFDRTRGMNILFKMTPWSSSLLKREANATLSLLNESNADLFEGCFISNLNLPVYRFDYQAAFLFQKIASITSQNADAYDSIFMTCFRLFSILSKALGDRITALNLHVPPYKSWSTSGPKPSFMTSDPLLVGILVHAENLGRTVDRGPSVEDKEMASAFCNFWGEKAELRRFQDGTILESLVWSPSTPQHPILDQIINHVLKRHFDTSNAKSVKIHGSLSETRSLSLIEFSSSSLAPFLPLNKAYEGIETLLRNLVGLPLRVRQVSPADAQLRYTSLRVPSDKSNSLKVPTRLNVQFEGSHRWPNTLPAIQRTKIAFLLKIGDLLEDSNSGFTARIGLDEADVELSNVAFLEVRNKSNVLFHLRIHHEHELFLLESALKASPYTGVTKEDAAAALSNYKRIFIQAPLFTQAVRSLVTWYPLLSPTIRLLKKWRNNHLLSDHISDELIELLTIHTFVHPQLWTEPGSIQTAFLRTLEFIGKWKWQSEPLIVDFKHDLKPTDIESIRTKLQAWRSIDPAMNRLAMFAASSIDHDGTTWTERGPSKVIAARFTSLAQAATALVKDQGIEIQLDTLFATNLSEYNFLIHMRSNFANNGNPDTENNAISEATHPTNQKFKNLHPSQHYHHHDRSAYRPQDLETFQPIRSYIQELRSLYGTHIVFLWDETETEAPVIAGLWNPHTTAPRAWKVKVGYSTIPRTGESAENEREGEGEREKVLLHLNKRGTLNDIARLGGDMVIRIEALGDEGAE